MYTIKQSCLSLVMITCLFFACTPNAEQQTSKVSSKDQKKTESKTESQPITQDLILYSGRSLSLIRPLLKKFEAQYKIKVKTRQDSSTTLANLLIQEGAQSTADVFWSQDPEAMAMVESKGLLAELPTDVEKNLTIAFQGLSKSWVATSGRLRILAYHQERAKDIPTSIFDLVKPAYKGRVGWAPTNASFQTFVTAMRIQHGDEKTKAWLQGMMKNEAKKYPKNTPIITALDAGEIDYGLPNHYYMLKAQKQGRAKKLAQKAFVDGDVGNLMSVAAIAVLKSSKNPSASKLLQFITSTEAQEYFAQEIKEYPIHKGVKADSSLASPDILKKSRAKVDLTQLKDRQGTIKLLRDVGLL